MITNTQSTNSTYLTTYTKYRIYNKGNANLRGDITHEKALHVEKNAHYEPIHAVDVTKDGKYIATCSSDKTIIIWETRRMRKLHTFYGHMDIVTAVSFSPNGKFLVSAGGTFDPTIKLWDAKIYKMLPQPDFPPEILTINRGYYKNIVQNGGKVFVHEPKQEEKNSEEKKMKKEEEVTGIDGENKSNEQGDTNANNDTSPKRKKRKQKKKKRRSKDNNNDTQTSNSDGSSSDYTSSDGNSSGNSSSSMDDDNKDFSNNLDDNQQQKRKEQREKDKKLMDKNGLDATKQLWESREQKKQRKKDELLLRGGLIHTFDVKKFGMEWYGHTGWINMVKYSNSGRRVASCSVDHKIKLWKPKNGM